MKHIKEYNEYEPSYYEISYQDYTDMHHNKERVYFESAEVNMLLDYLKPKDSKIITSQKAFIQFEINRQMWKKHYKINLFRFEDEWFCLSINNEYNKSSVTYRNPYGHYYYKCDQISGVIDFLKFEIYKEKS